MEKWERFVSWMAEIIGSVVRIFRGEVDTGIPTGPVTSPPKGNYPKIVQLSISKITNNGCTVSFELDRNGDLYWGIFDADLNFNKGNITSGALSSAYGVNSAVGDTFTSFEVTNKLAQGTAYIFACYTKDDNAESDILEEIEFETTGVSEPGTVTIYGDAYNENYG